MGGAEASRGVEALKPKHGPRALLHLAVVLLQEVIRVPRRTMGDCGPELKPNRAGVGAVAVRGDAEWTALANELCRAEEGPRGGKVTGLTQARVQ
jgi:hypothetical protein